MKGITAQPQKQGDKDTAQALTGCPMPLRLLSFSALMEAEEEDVRSARGGISPSSSSGVSVCAWVGEEL